MANKIAIYGGAFNPPHPGHLSILLALAQDERYSEILVVPSFQHPDGKELLDFEVRLRWMLELSYLVPRNLRHKVKVSTLERDFPAIKFTSDLIDVLRSTRCEDIVFVTGADNAKRISQGNSHWANVEKLLSMCKIAVISRNNQLIEEFSSYDWYETGYPISVDISSTEIRQALRQFNTKKVLSLLGSFPITLCEAICKEYGWVVNELTFMSPMDQVSSHLRLAVSELSEARAMAARYKLKVGKNSLDTMIQAANIEQVIHMISFEGNNRDA